ncbi:hypothetical protein DPMN_114644 [Dreissena polymorpha]|uniref:ADAMTS-like protein 3 n=2 Tax=Dreissena polymorpha TaxID=45954 RepID=A0A9D4QRR7_DREPO|nr:hypothetical protein DPMN_114644 [Dreissena polymorpha]
MVDAHACAHVDMPTDTRASCSQGICPSDWRVGPWQNCTRDCGGGISWRIVTCVKTNEDDTQILVRDSECDENKRPSSRKSCNGLMCPTWHAGEWSVCSVSCGKGVQRREVVCRHVGDVFCHEVEKPRTVKTCTTGVPCYDLAGDIQERKVGEFGGGDGIQGDQAITKEDLYTPRFVTTTWDSCSATCGEGVHFRYVRCQVFLRYLDDYVDLPDEDCSDEAKPAEKEVCMVEPCYDQYHWVPVGMTACSHTCLGGIQETIFACMSKVNQMTVADSFCAEAPHVQVERRVCNDRPCPQRWDLGAFGSCSKSCGGGVKSRAVKCIQEYAQNSVLNLPDFMCAQPGPPFTTYCNDMDCPAHWTVGNWSMCSVTCGIGVQMRIPLCQRVQNSSLVNVSLSDCDVTVKPLTEMSCNLTACPQPKIKVNKLKLFQLNKIRTIRLSAGMEGHILPDTNIVIKCPNVGLDRQKVTWFKNGLKFRRSKRAKVARSGALRIRQAYPGRDDAVYSCLIGGLEANVTISFISSFELLQAKILREKYLNGKEDNHNVLNKTVYYKDPIDRKRKPLTLISTEWSRCSVTCGGGLQSRNISCELISSRYYAALPKEECFRHSAVSPALIQSCNVDPCVEWQTGNWSECSDLDCVRYEYSIQRRSVDCVNLFNDTVTNSSWCTGLGFPPDSIRDCFNRNCSVKWLTSKWSECIADCGEKGIRVRSYKCVWSGSELPATFGSCDVIARPATTRTCKAKPCEDLECRDESENCPLVAQTALCDYPAYKRTCCKSCRNQSDIDNDTEEAKT